MTRGNFIGTSILIFLWHPVFANFYVLWLAGTTFIQSQVIKISKYWVLQEITSISIALRQWPKLILGMMDTYIRTYVVLMCWVCVIPHLIFNRKNYLWYMNVHKHILIIDLKENFCYWIPSTELLLTCLGYSITNNWF